MPLILLDRDGVINVDRPDSVRSKEQLELIPRSAEAIARLNQEGVSVAVITNQSIVGRGIITMDALHSIHEEISHRLARSGARIDAWYVCPDAPDHATARRKPAPGMLLEALQDFRANPTATPFVGDAITDLQAAHAAGCPRMLVTTGKGIITRDGGWETALNPVTLCHDLYEAVAIRLKAA